jgi:hypothetical protein
VLPRAEEPARLPPRGAPVGQVAFVLALLAPAAAALRRGARGVGLACLGAPLAWALAAAVTDLFDASAAWTWGAYAAAVLGWLRWTRAPSVAAAHAPPLSRGARAALGALALLALALAMHQCGRALDGMLDARSMYNLRGRLIVHDARFLAPFGQTQTWHPQHPDYPPLLSFAVAGAYRAIGAAAPAGPLGLQAAFWLGFGLLLFDCCRRRLGTWPAVAAVALVFVSPTTARVVSYQVCDAPLAFTLGAALLAWRAAHASGDGAPARRWASLAGLLLGVCALLKNEGLMLGAVFWLVALARAWRGGATRRAWLRAALAALPAYALLLAFKLQAPENDVVAHAAFGARLLERAPAIARAFALELLDPRAFACVFPLAFAALVYTRRRPRGGPDRELGALILLALAAFVAVYLVSPHDIHWHLGTSLRRVLLQLYPAALVLLFARLAALDAGAPVSYAPSRRPGRRR